MFHMAYLIGSYISCRIILKEDQENREVYGISPWSVLFQLNMAHILVPVFTFLQMICHAYGYNVLEKTLELISII